jgi:hypothetical protein
LLGAAHDNGYQLTGQDKAMTREQAEEKCAKALARRQGYRDEDWKNVPSAIDFGKDVVVCLVELGLLKFDK